MRDYWLEQGHNGCDSGCTSPLHAIYEAYMDSPSSKEPMSKLENALVHMFEIRINLEFSLDDIFGVTMNAFGEDHYMAKSDLQHMALEFHQFAETHGRLATLLDSAQRDLISHLSPISDRMGEIITKIPDMRTTVVNPGRGLFEAMAKSDGNGHVLASAPDNSILVCANLINTFVDGLLHTMPDVFRLAFGKLPSNDESVTLDALKSFRAKVSSYAAQNPTHCLNFTAMGDASVPIAFELIRLQWALRSSVDLYCKTNKLQTVPHQMSRTWSQLQYRRMILYLRHAAAELHVLIDLHDRMRKASPAPLADDGPIKELLDHRDTIGQLRNIAVCRTADGEHGEFSAALKEGIGHERLIFLAAIASEWTRINANHFQEQCEYGALVPDLPDVGRYLYLMDAEREAALYRVRAQNALARKGAIPAMA